MKGRNQRETRRVYADNKTDNELKIKEVRVAMLNWTDSRAGQVVER